MGSAGHIGLPESAHLLVINRWQETYAQYASYISHQNFRVSYLSTEIGLGSVPDSATDVAVVDGTESRQPGGTAGLARPCSGCLRR